MLELNFEKADGLGIRMYILVLLYKTVLVGSKVFWIRFYAYLGQFLNALDRPSFWNLDKAFEKLRSSIGSTVKAVQLLDASYYFSLINVLMKISANNIFRNVNEIIA